MTSMPVEATANHAKQTISRSGDAVVVRGIAAFLVLLSLAALFLLDGPVSYVVAGSIVVGALALFWAAAWRRAER